VELERFSVVVESVYDCSFDPALWPQTLAEIADYLDSSTARLFLFNNDVKLHGFGSSVGIDDGFNRRFDHDLETLNSIKYGFVVSQIDVALTLDEILGANGGRDANGKEMFDNRYYQDWMVPNGYHDALAALMVKNARNFGGLAMTRSTGQPRFSDPDREKVRLLAPHIRRALALSDLIDQKSVERTRFADVIDGLTTPVMMVEPGGRILHANTRAQDMIALGDVVGSKDGVASAAHADSRAAFTALLGAAVRGAQSVVLRKRSGGELIASLLPLGKAQGVIDAAAAPAAVFFHDPDREIQLPGEALAKLYRLTGAELRLLLAIAHGATLQDIADRSGTAIGTVRTHLKNLFYKTGKSRQSELVQMAMLAISPVKGPNAR
jgi:DNA-binding CsgD family transcriptional regulator/PAS domain-containing protein